MPALVRYLRREQPDALLSALNRANFAALWARRLAGAPGRVVVNEQNTLSQESLNTSNPFIRLTPYLARFFYGWADSVVGVSQGVVDDLVQEVGVSPQRVKVIYNPGVTPDLRERAQSPLDHPWFQSGEPPLFLAVGRLMKQKDFTNLIKAFALVRQSRPARLLILGEGPERQMLEALIQQLDVVQDVGLPGFVDNPFSYMTRASAFVLSSLWEGLPTVLMEALYCGAPIVATDCPSGPREILGEDNAFGCLVPAADADALADAITAAISNYPAWQAKTTPARQHIIERYSLKPGLRRLEAIFDELIRGRSSDRPSPRQP